MIEELFDKFYAWKYKKENQVIRKAYCSRPISIAKQKERYLREFCNSYIRNMSNEEARKESYEYMEKMFGPEWWFLYEGDVKENEHIMNLEFEFEKVKAEYCNRNFLIM